MIRAFTILETLITLALLAIIVLLGYYLYQSGQHFFNRFEDSGKQLFEQENQLYALHDRIESSTYWVAEGTTLRLVYAHRPENYLVYTSTSLILETGTLTDTIRIEQPHVEIIPETQLVQAFSFYLIMGSNRYPYRLEKRYAATDLMQYENSH